MNPYLEAKLSAIDADKSRMNSAPSLPPRAAAALLDKIRLEWTYHSNAIEGNTLSLSETKAVIEGLTIEGKTPREHIEATNHRDAISYVDEIVQSQDPLSERLIKDLHKLVLDEIEIDDAGRYRRKNVVIAGASTTPPHFLHLGEEMQEMIDWNLQAGQRHPIERAAELHTRFVEIHPFVDGNGRTGRLLLNFELMKAGYPPAVIRAEDRLAYYDALNEACVSSDYTKITCLVAEAIHRNIDAYLSLLPLNRKTVQK